MPPASPSAAIHIEIINRHSLDAQLDQAISTLIHHARSLGDRGILVTRKSPQDVTVELHSDVPYGVTYEQQNW
jgi:hypothetical protein